MGTKYFHIFAIVILAAGLFTGFITPQTSQASQTRPFHSLAVSQTGLYIVRLADPAVASYTGGVNGLEATSPHATGARRLDANAPASQAYASYLAEKQQGLLSAMHKAYGHEVELVYQYLYTLDAMAVRISHEEALRAFDLPGVLTVYPDTIRQPDTDMGPTLIGAPAVWDGDTYGDLETMGEGMVAGILDTGINFFHISFAEEGGDGYIHTNPYGAGVYHGWCEENAHYCNEKLIGAYNLLYLEDPEMDDQNPEDDDGHGSHTASTVAGNFVEAAFMIGETEILRDISGVAPHANVVAYKVCAYDDVAGTSHCYDAPTLAAIDLAISTDMVDVLNYSISGGDNPWTDPVDLAFLDAFAAGIFVSASAGNTGPGLGTVAHTGPWNSSTAASTHSRIYANLVDVTAAGGPMTAIPSLPGATTVLDADIAGGIKYDEVYRYACEVIPAETYTGMIALVQRGCCTFDVKMTNVFNAGAIAMIAFNSVGGPPIVMGNTLSYIPAVMITMEDGLALSTLITGDATATAIIYAETSLAINPDWEDIMASFSSRGPSQYEVLKPDYTAPGVNILAAYKSAEDIQDQYAFLQGTSMSSPHSAGAAILMMDLRPDWTVAEIRSAMSSTTDPDVLDTNGLVAANYWAMGSGRLDLYNAAHTGLVLDESAENFIAADPNTGGVPRDLNMPYLVNLACIDTCSWMRTVTSVYTEETTWDVVIIEPDELNLTVSEKDFELTLGMDQELEITAHIGDALPDAVLYAEIQLVPRGDGETTRIPVVVVVDAPPAIIEVTPLALESTQLAGQQVDQTLTIGNTGVRDLEWEIYEDSIQTIGLNADWMDNFDTYTLGSIQDQGGWKGWFNDPTAAGVVTADVALSLNNSQAIEDVADSVHEYAGYDTGLWNFSTMTYVPTDFTGFSYFQLLNSYDDAGTDLNWSTAIGFSGDENLIGNTCSSGGVLPLIKGEWVELRVEINLFSDEQTVYYGDELLFSGTWTEECSGGGVLNIASVDLFANGATVMYYDDMSLTVGVPDVCQIPGDIPWLSVDPAAGVTIRNEESLVAVTFDSAGLSNGTYTGNICVASNDPVTQLVVVPVTLNVYGNIFTYMPLMWKVPEVLVP